MASYADKVFTEEQAIAIIKAMIESGSIKFFGSTDTTYSAEEAGEQDATYLKALFAYLTKEFPPEL